VTRDEWERLRPSKNIRMAGKDARKFDVHMTMHSIRAVPLH